MVTVRTVAGQARYRERYRQLNKRQREAVEAIEGPVMVVAGPGTGKTEVVAMRIANILQHGQMDPWNVLCLTFTESGVAAMRARLVSISGATGYYVRIHTFHSFCNEIMREHPELFATGADWQTLSESERVLVLRSLLDRLPGTSPLKPLGQPYLYVRDVADAIRTLKQEGLSPERFATILQAISHFVGAAAPVIERFRALSAKQRGWAECRHVVAALTAAGSAERLPESLLKWPTLRWQGFVAAGERSSSPPAARASTAFKNDLTRWFGRLTRQLPKQAALAQVYQWYQAELTRRGRYDYEDMIMQVGAALMAYPALLAEYQERFQYIVVDEYQDTNGGQNEIVERLGSYDDQPNICVVGDDKQSIFRFQGASVANMLAFYERYQPHVRVVTLVDNYRNQPAVLAAAEALIVHNEESLARYIPTVALKLTPRAGLKAQPLLLLECGSEAQEDDTIVRRVRALLKAGAAPRSISVLFRYNRDGESLFSALRHGGIPARLELGENVLADPRIKQWMALLKYLAAPQQEAVLGEVVQFGWWQLDALDTLKVLAAFGGGRSLLTLLADRDALEALGVRAPAGWLTLAQRLARWRREAAHLTLPEFLTRLAADAGWLAWALVNPEQTPAIPKLAALLDEAKAMAAEQPDISLQEFCQRLQLLREHGLPLLTKPWHGPVEAVRLLTAHKAKGQEFEHVCIVRLNDRHWGNNPDVQRVPLPLGLVRSDFILAREHNEDERRLLYVALTRARKTVVLTRAAFTSAGRPTAPSLFLGELPDGQLKRVVVTETVPAVMERVQERVQPAVVDESAVREWLKEQLTSYVLSVTHLNTYLTCRRAFFVKHVLRLPSVRTPRQALGAAVHGALDAFGRAVSLARRRGARLPDGRSLLKLFRERGQREVLTPVERAHVQAVGERHLTGYLRARRASLMTPALTEYDFSSHQVRVAGVPITGKLDRVELVASSLPPIQWPVGAPVVVVDYKTGRPERGVRRLQRGGDYWRQLVFYQVLCDTSPRFPYRMRYGQVEFVEASLAGEYLVRRQATEPADTEALVQDIVRVWQEIQALAFMAPDAGCGQCAYCELSSVAAGFGRARRRGRAGSV